MRLIHGDCLEKMKDIESGSVDMILTDPPYGTTACKWDSIIPLNKYIVVRKGKKDVVIYEDEWVMNEAETTYKSIHHCRDEFRYLCKFGMWDHLNRIIKHNGAIVMTASQPFTTTLINSNIKMFKYCWVWDKVSVSNPQLAKIQPLKHHEDITVFSKKKHNYIPQGLVSTGNKPKQKTSKPGDALGDEKLGHIQRRKDYVQLWTNYPKSIQRFSRASGLHPTQKPTNLMEYLIKTYTNENETVLDFTMGSGTTGVACKNTNRDFIGIELDENYFNIAKKRIEEA